MIRFCIRCGRQAEFTVEDGETNDWCDECTGFGPPLKLKRHDQSDQVVMLRTAIRNAKRAGEDTKDLEARLEKARSAAEAPRNS